MKRGLVIALVVITLIYVFGMLYYDNRVKLGLSPWGSCGCTYEQGDSFNEAMEVIEIKKDTCSLTNVCSRGYCIIEYGNPGSNERFTYTASCN